MKLIVLIILLPFCLSAQDTSLPYYELPDPPSIYTAGTVAARQVDALGFRFYWATEGLVAADLEFKPSEKARSTKETIVHIFDLSCIIINATTNTPNTKQDKPQDYLELRKQTLLNLNKAASILSKSTDISQYQIIFGTSKFPLWNLINGPIADATWHCGQIASFRRISGHPINPKVNHFTGKIKK